MNSHFQRFLAILFASAFVLSVPAGAEQAGELFSGFGAKSKDPIHVDAETLEIYEEGDQRISVFSGSVNVVRGNSTLKAAKLKLFSNKDSKTDDDSAFTRMEASGSVYVNSKNQTVTGQSAVVDNKAQTITMVGNVVLTQGKNVIVGDKLVIDMATGRARVIQTPGKRIQGMFTPDEKKGKGKDGEKSGEGDKDKAAKPATPAATAAPATAPKP